MNLARMLELWLGVIDPQQVTNFILVALLGCFLLAIVLARRQSAPGFVHYVPNLLTTIGILGTFVGIVIGLLGFDISDISSSIGPLLAGLKTAFITSVVGVFLAIVFKTAETSGLLTKNHQNEELVDHIGPEEIHSELRAHRYALERLVLAIVGDEESTLVTQIRLLRSDARDDAKRASGQFEAFSVDLWKKLDEFADMLSRSATEQVISALEEVISDFNHNLTEQFGDNFKELNAAVEKLVQWQEQYRIQLGEMSAQYNQGVQAIQQTEEAVAHIGVQAQQIPVCMEGLKAIIETAQHQLEELERHLTAFRDMRDRAVEAVPQIREQMDKMALDVASAAKAAGQEIVAASQAVNTAIVEGAKEFEDRVNRTNEGITSASDHLANNSERIREQLEDTVKEINEQVRTMVVSVTDHAKSIGETLVESNQKLGSSIEATHSGLTDSIEKMQKRLESSLEEVLQAQSREIGRMFSGLQEEITRTVGTTGEAVNRQLEAVDKAMEQELQRVIGVLGSKLGAVTRKFAEDYSDLTSQMQQVVGQARKFDSAVSAVR